MEGWIGDGGSIYPYGVNVFENPVVAPIPIPGIEVRPAPDLIPQNIAVTADGPIQSGGQVTIAWQTRNDGNVAATGNWSDRVILRNVASGQILGNFPLDATQAKLPPGATPQHPTTAPRP